MLPFAVFEPNDEPLWDHYQTGASYTFEGTGHEPFKEQFQLSELDLYDYEKESGDPNEWKYIAVRRYF